VGEGRSDGSVRDGFHPVWWAALVLLVVNDHFLKGSGWVPSFLTGKLSDVTGLFVAPILVGRVIRRGPTDSTALRAFSFLAVGVAFALVNLSQTCADWMAAILGAFGFPSRVWADPSDLWALLVLPLAWRLERPSSHGHGFGDAELSRSESWSKLAVISGGLACLATSTDVDAVYTSSYLFNATRYELSVDVHPMREGFDCESVKSDPSSALSGDAWEDGTCELIDPFEMLVLDPHATSQDEGESTVPEDHCDAALVRMDGAVPLLLVWDSSPRAIVPRSTGEPDFERVLSDPHSVLVEQLGDERLLAPGTHIQSFEITSEEGMPTSSCGGEP